MERIASYVAIAVILNIVLVVASKVVTINTKNISKVSGYECGYTAKKEEEKTIDIKYFIIAILFMIFDLEISYIYPWIITEKNDITYYTMIYLIYILTIAFIFEYRVGAMKW